MAMSRLPTWSCPSRPPVTTSHPTPHTHPLALLPPSRAHLSPFTPLPTSRRSCLPPCAVSSSSPSNPDPSNLDPSSPSNPNQPSTSPEHVPPPMNQPLDASTVISSAQAASDPLVEASAAEPLSSEGIVEAVSDRERKAVSQREKEAVSEVVVEAVSEAQSGVDEVDPDSVSTVVLQEAWERLQEVNREMQLAVAKEDYRAAAVLKREADSLTQQMSPVQLYLMEEVELLQSGTDQQKMDAIQALWDCSFTTMIPEYLQDKAVEAVLPMFGEPSTLPEVEKLVRQFCQLLFQSNEDEIAAFSVFKQLVDLDPDKAMLMASILKARVVNGKFKRSGTSPDEPGSNTLPPDFSKLDGPDVSISSIIIHRKGPDTLSPESLSAALPPELQKALEEDGIPMEVFDDDNLWQALASDSVKVKKTEDKSQGRKGKPRKWPRAVKLRVAAPPPLPPLRRPNRPPNSEDSSQASHSDGSGNAADAREEMNQEMVDMCALLMSGNRDDKARGIAKLWEYCSSRQVSFDFQLLALAAVRSTFKSPTSDAEQTVIDALCLNVLGAGGDPAEVLNLYISMPNTQANLDNSVLVGTVLCHRLGIDVQFPNPSSTSIDPLTCQALILPGSSTSFTDDMAALANACKSALTSIFTSAHSLLKAALPFKPKPKKTALLSSTSASLSSASTTTVDPSAKPSSNTSPISTDSKDNTHEDSTAGRDTNANTTSNGGSTGGSTGSSTGSSTGRVNNNHNQGSGVTLGKSGTSTTRAASQGTRDSGIQSKGKSKARVVGPEPPPSPVASSSGRNAAEGAVNEDVLEAMLAAVLQVPANMRRQMFQEVLNTIKQKISTGSMRVSPEMMKRLKQVEKALGELPQPSRTAEAAVPQRLSDDPHAEVLLLLSEHMSVMRSSSASMDMKLPAMLKVFDAHLNDLLPDYMLRLAQEAVIAMFPSSKKPELQSLVTAFSSCIFAPSTIAIADACRLMDKMCLVDTHHGFIAGSILECILEYDHKHFKAQETASELGALFAQEKRPRAPPRKGGKRKARKVEPEPPTASDDQENGGDKAPGSK